MTKEEILQLSEKACKNTLMETLGIEFVDAGEDYMIAKMPVTSKVHQPDGVLHGGASVVLAESVGSMASYVFEYGGIFHSGDRDFCQPSEERS